MKISVIMPVYNGEKYLNEAIDSILNQTFKDFEFIIINDCSSDNTDDIIKSYKDDRIVYLVNEKNLGISDTLNRGFSVAKGEYVARMDSDDIALPDRFEKQVAYLDANQNVGVCGSNAIVFSEDNEYITTLPVEHKDIFFELYFSSQLIHPTVMIRKNVLDSLDCLYDRSWNGREDYELWTRLIQITKFHNIKQPLLRYRVHSSQITSNKKPDYIEKTAEIKYKFFKSTSISISFDECLIFSRYCVGKTDFSLYELNVIRNILNSIFKAHKSGFKIYFIHLHKLSVLKKKPVINNLTSYTVTCHDVYNYGASLQAYALQQYLFKIGICNSVIDYIPCYLSRLFDFKSIPDKISNNFALTILYKIYLFIVQLRCVPKYIRYKRFNKNHLKLTSKKYTDNNQMKCLAPADIYFCGSDQIWNNYNFDCGKDPGFFLDFAPENSYRFSYAASFGSDKVDSEYNKFVYDMTSKFDMISVREKSGIEILNNLGINNVELVADPVFLLDKCEWGRISKKSKCKKPYILVYTFDNKEFADKVVNDLSNQNNLEIKDFSFRKNAYSSGPLEFLNLIKNAEIIVTNSFHAIAFSIIFNKKFIAVSRSEGGLSERIDNILNVFELTDRKLDSLDNAQHLYDLEIDYEKVNNSKEIFVSKSKKYIERCIGLAKENNRTDTTK